MRNDEPRVDQQDVGAPYDEVPYGGLAIPRTHPDQLALRARLKGIDAPSTETCRVLELGCAEAVNLAAMAFHLPRSQFLGIDASDHEIEIGLESRARLGLDNLELRRAEFLELGDELGSFDYIICHGVLSWVDEPTQQKIFDICRDHLTPLGVAYLSYNCAAGWALKSQVRRAMLRRVRDTDSTPEKIRRVREIMSLLTESPLRETSHGAILANQLSAAASHRDEYLLHEYLAAFNRPFHFREIVELAEERDLAFLVEVERSTSVMEAERKVRAELAERFDDPIEIEELADLMLFRTFRSTLFCHREALESAIAPADATRALMVGATLAGNFRAQSERPSLEPAVDEAFETGEGTTFAISQPHIKAALIELGKAWPRGLSLEELEERAFFLLAVRRVIEPGGGISNEELSVFRAQLFELFEFGQLDLRVREPSLCLSVSATPKVSALTGLEATQNSIATTPLHSSIFLNSFARLLMRYLDGTNDMNDLVSRMREHVDAGDISASIDDGTPIDGDKLEEDLPAIITHTLDVLAHSALLVK